MSQTARLVFLIFCLAILLALKLIPDAHFLTNKTSALVLWVLMSGGSLAWGITDLREYRRIHGKKHIPFFSMLVTPAEIRISHGQIIGGIIGLVGALVFAVKWGFR